MISMTATVVTVVAMLLALAIGQRLLRGIAELPDPFARVSRAFAALTLLMLASLPSSAGSEWQIWTSVTLGVLTVVTWGAGLLRRRRV